MQPNKTFLSSWEQNKYDESVFETPKKKPKVSGIFEQGNTVPKSLKSSSKLKFPDRVMGNFQKDFESTYAMHVEFDRERNRKKTSNNEIDARRDSQDKTTATVLASEMFPDVPIPHLNPPHTPKRHHTTITDFTLPSPKYIKSPIANFSKSNFSSRARDFLTSPRKSPRQIAKNPFKVLDAPELADDFYLNLVDWGNSNVLSVGLGSCVYLWNSQNSKVTRLCDLSTSSDTVTSVTWNPKGDRLAVGTNKGLVQIYDVQATTKIQEYQDHTARVGALAWSNDLLTSGSRDRTITHRDPLKPNAAIRKLTSHKQEVCGLKWNPDFTQLASGGNDNKLFIWDKSSNGTNPILRLNDHTAGIFN